MGLVYLFLDFIRFLLYLLTVLIIARAVLSWFSLRRTGQLETYLFRVTEPFLAPLRRISPRAGGIDFSPLVAVLLAQLLIIILNHLY